MRRVVAPPSLPLRPQPADNRRGAADIVVHRPSEHGAPAAPRAPPSVLLCQPARTAATAPPTPRPSARPPARQIAAVFEIANTGSAPLFLGNLTMSVAAAAVPTASPTISLLCAPAPPP